MKKIPTALVRDPDDRAHVLEQVTPGCEWVFAGEGVATRKYDGTCMMLDDDDQWWARREVKPGKSAPDNYVLEDHDETTGKSQGWEPVAQSAFAKFHAEALNGYLYRPGTYELVGPKVNGDPEKIGHHALFSHAGAETIRIPSYEIAFVEMFVRNLADSGWEGIVWHHPDGRMAKLKGRDIPAVLSDANV